MLMSYNLIMSHVSWLQCKTMLYFIKTIVQCSLKSAVVHIQRVPNLSLFVRLKDSILSGSSWPILEKSEKHIGMLYTLHASQCFSLTLNSFVCVCFVIVSEIFPVITAVTYSDLI